MLWFDEYERRARAAPGLLAVLPIAIVATVVGLRTNPLIGTIFGLITAAGGPLILAAVVRQKGLALQEALFERWGGPPTTNLIRLSSRVDNPEVRTVRRAAVERMSGVSLPLAEQERVDPQSADALIAAGVTVVRESTRDTTRFPLVFAENRNYGFERNMLAIRTIALAILLVSGLVLAGEAIAGAAGWAHISALALAIGAAAIVAVGAGWWFYPSEERVQQAAARYASALLDAASAVPSS